MQGTEVQPEVSRDERSSLREVPLGGGRTLVVRPVRGDDLEPLATLYAGLDDGDRYRRFFSGYRPPRSFFERLTNVGDRGGARLVAVACAPDGDSIVGEAGYELLPDGDGDVAITVARSWRGWLGPYLLDALGQEAVRNGVRNLEADILLSNGPMLALVRYRGYAARQTSDWSVLSAIIGTRPGPPSWPHASGRGRVLVEGSGGHWHGGEALRNAGFEVLACPGPVQQSRRCPALHGQACPLAAAADVIILTNPVGDSWNALRATHPRLHAGVPVCVEARHGCDIRGDECLLPPGEGAELTGFLEQRIASRPPRE